ncbi:MAG: GNAT family N-acetyltransferase [Acidimicrobiia bacterium]|nr:GNAT family N-acetyltransferase [Acidimicrobiia bacterium]
MGELVLPVDSARLRLRRFTPADALAFAAYRSDPAVARFQGWSTPFEPDAASRFIAAQADLAGPTRGRWVQIAVEHAGELIGDVAVRLDDDGRLATIGYTLAPAHQGRGFAREAVACLLDHLLDTLGVHRVEASLDPRNVASARLLERLGFDHEGTFLSAVVADGEWTDDDHYALTADRRRTWNERQRARPDDVRFVEVTAGNRQQVLRLEIHHSQQRFVAPMAQSFADALVPDVVDGEPVVPWFRAIEADSSLAGFVMIAARTEAHPEAYLWRLLVDRWHQRRGIGERALELLVEQLRADGHETLLVSWHPGAGGPEPFYLDRGFVPTGIVEDGEIEARLRL